MFPKADHYVNAVSVYRSKKDEVRQAI